MPCPSLSWSLNPPCRPQELQDLVLQLEKYMESLSRDDQEALSSLTCASIGWSAGSALEGGGGGDAGGSGTCEESLGVDSARSSSWSSSKSRGAIPDLDCPATGAPGSPSVKTGFTVCHETLSCGMAREGGEEVSIARARNAPWMSSYKSNNQKNDSPNKCKLFRCESCIYHFFTPDLLF
jgi:hypothetical protein